MGHVCTRLSQIEPISARFSAIDGNNGHCNYPSSFFFSVEKTLISRLLSFNSLLEFFIRFIEILIFYLPTWCAVSIRFIVFGWERGNLNSRKLNGASGEAWLIYNIFFFIKRPKLMFMQSCTLGLLMKEKLFFNPLEKKNKKIQ